MASSDNHSNGSNISVVTARLFEIILDMPFQDRRTLLKELEAKHSQGRRKYARKPYFMPVDFATPNRAFSGFIQNISSGGLLIETRETLPVGDQNPEIMSRWAVKLSERYPTVSALNFIRKLKVFLPKLIVSNL